MDESDYTTKSTKICQDKLREHFNRVVVFSDSTQNFLGPESWGISAWLQGSGRGFSQFFPTTVRRRRCFEMWIWQMFFQKWIVNMYHLDPHLFIFHEDTYKNTTVKKNLTLNKTHKKSRHLYLCFILKPTKTQLQELLPLETSCFWHTFAHCTMAKSWESKGTGIPPTPKPS